MIVDAHQHFWDPARAEYPWMTGAFAPLHRRFGPSELEPLLREYAIDGTVVVQARPSLDETRELLELAGTTPFVLGVVGWVDLAGDEHAVDVGLAHEAAEHLGLVHAGADRADDALLAQPCERGKGAGKRLLIVVVRVVDEGDVDAVEAESSEALVERTQRCVE